MAQFVMFTRRSQAVNLQAKTYFAALKEMVATHYVAYEDHPHKLFCNGKEVLAENAVHKANEFAKDLNGARTLAELVIEQKYTPSWWAEVAAAEKKG